MAFFTRKADAPPVPQLPAPTGPQPAVLPAPRANNLEQDIRREIWQHMGPDLARAAGLSVPELLDFVSGVTRLSQPQLTALGRKMGLIVGAETGIDKLRAKLVAMMRKRTDFGWLNSGAAAGGREFAQLHGGGKLSDPRGARRPGQGALRQAHVD